MALVKKIKDRKVNIEFNKEFIKVINEKIKKQDTDFAIFTIRDEDKNSHTYYQYIKYEERKMKDIHEVLELTIPLTDREQIIIDFYEDRIMDMQSEVADEIQEARDSVDELLHELSDLEDEVSGDLQEELIEELERQEAEERRKSIQDTVGKE